MQKVEKKMTQSYVLPWKEKELESGRKNIPLSDEVKYSIDGKTLSTLVVPF